MSAPDEIERFWEQRCRGSDALWSGRPSALLVEAVRALDDPAPGTALALGRGAAAGRRPGGVRPRAPCRMLSIMTDPETPDAASPRRSSALARLRTALPVLGPSERRVAEVLIAHREEVVEWSTAEVAAAAQTSPATVIRACQNVGFRGFQHLRLELARSAPEAPVPGSDPVAQLVGEAVDVLSVTRDSLDAEAFERTVRALLRAPRVVLVGSGFSAPPVLDASMRFATAGRPVEAPGDVLAQQFAARSLGPQDVCLAVSYSGANAHTLQACAAAREGGATVVAVTSFTRSPLVRLTDVALVTGAVDQAHDVDPALSRLGHSLVLHALSVRLLAEAPHRPGATDRMRDVVVDALSDG